MGATIDAEPHALTRCGAAAFRSRRSTLDCNHIPDAAMTLAALALFADGPSRLDATSPAGASRRPTGSRRWPPSCARSAPSVVEGDDSLAITPPARWRAAAIDDLRRPPHGDGDVARRVQRRSPARAAAAGADRRSALRRQDLARLLRGAVLGRPARPRRHPGADDRRPDRLGQGHAGERGRRRARLRAARLGRRLPRGRRSPRCRPASTPTTRPALEALAPAHGPALRRRPRPSSPAPTSRDSLRLEAVGALASRISAWPARARRRRSACRLAFRRLPGLVADGRDMGTRRLPRRRAQGVPHRERRRTRRAAATSN